MVPNLLCHPPKALSMHDGIVRLAWPTRGVHHTASWPACKTLGLSGVIPMQVEQQEQAQAAAAPTEGLALPSAFQESAEGTEQSGVIALWGACLPMHVDQMCCKRVHTYRVVVGLEVAAWPGQPGAVM